MGGWHLRRFGKRTRARRFLQELEEKRKRAPPEPGEARAAGGVHSGGDRPPGRRGARAPRARLRAPRAGCRRGPGPTATGPAPFPRARESPPGEKSAPGVPPAQRSGLPESHGPPNSGRSRAPGIWF